jgi:LysM repeat protein
MSKILLIISVLLTLGTNLLLGQTYQTHRVSYGETLYGIAKKYTITVETLQRTNNLRGSTIHPGEELLIPMGQGQTRSNQRVMTEERTNLRVLETASGAANRRVAAPPTTRSAYQRNSYQASTQSPSLVQRAEDVWVRTNLALVGELRPIGNTAFRDRSQAETPRRSVEITDRSGSVTRSNDDNKRYTTTAPTAEPKGERIYHRVGRSEDIYDVAEQYGIDTEAIQRWNDTKTVYTGQTLIIFRDETKPIIDPDKPSLDQIADRLQGNEQGTTRSNDPFMPDANRRVTNTSEAAKTETGSFDTFEWPDTKEAYYMAHKRLKPGTKVKVAIPGTDGHLSVLVKAYQGDDSPTDYSFSPALVRLLESAGAKGEATLMLDQ